jgi:dTDP-4-amino-4,6-dideoxygalactose transaminase
MLARYRGASIARSGGDYICWSFQAIKHLTTGDGGALLCPAEQFDRARLLRWYGLDRTKSDSFRCNQDIAAVGFKYHMNDIAAAIGLANLGLVRSVVQAHQENAQFFCEALQGLEDVRVPDYNPESAWWLYTVRTKRRDEFITAMARCGIAASPVHTRNDKHSALRDYADEVLPGTDEFSQTEVAIPVGWWVTSEQRDRIVEAVTSWHPKSLEPFTGPSIADDQQEDRDVSIPQQVS